jgi:hypothetical protein
VGQLYSRLGSFRGRVLVVALAAAIVALAAMASSASATVASQWSGASTTSQNWTDTHNWDFVPGSGSTLVFSNLGSCASPAACYVSDNNETAGFNVGQIAIDDGVPYDIFGNGITLGATGLSASATTTSSPGNHVQLAVPIALGANQAWTIDGGGSGQGVDLTGLLTGEPNTLGVTLSNSGILISESQNQEVGDVTVTGSDSGQTGLNAPNNGVVALTSGGDLNGTDNHTVTLHDAALSQGDNVTIGALTSTGGELQIGNGIAPPGILTVHGTVSLDSNTATLFSIGGGTTPGTDYGQLDAGSNNVTLDGALELNFAHHGGPCPTLNVGDVDTLITTTGTITGTFASVPDGTVVSTPGLGVCGQTQFRINYHTGSSPETVTATVVDNTPHSTSQPTISGNLSVGQTLTESHATWSSNGGSAPSSYTYAWSQCDTSGNNCLPVGTDSQTYTLQSSDQGHTIRVTERAANNVNQAAQAVTSSPTGVVAGPPSSAATPPVLQTAPLVIGSNVVGGKVSTTDGVWGGSTPMSFAIQWQRCGVTCSNIPGATHSSYTLTNADLNKRVRAVVAATNGGGPVFAVSNQVGPVRAPLFEIRGLLLATIVPKGKADSIKAILKAGGAVLTVTALEPGVEKISWYFLPPGAHVARAHHHAKPVLVATGRISFSAPGSAHLKLKLTKAGKRLLRHARRMKLTAKGTFRPTNQGGASVNRKFKLKR